MAGPQVVTNGEKTSYPHSPVQAKRLPEAIRKAEVFALEKLQNGEVQFLLKETSIENKFIATILIEGKPFEVAVEKTIEGMARFRNGNPNVVSFENLGTELLAHRNFWASSTNLR